MLNVLEWTAQKGLICPKLPIRYPDSVFLWRKKRTIMDHMDREPRKHLPGITAKRRRKGVQGVHLNAGDSHAYRAYTRYAWDLCIYCHPLHPWGIKMKRIKRMRPKKGATFLPERYYLSRSLQPPFSGNTHQICYPIGRILIVTQITQITQIFFRPPDS